MVLGLDQGISLSVLIVESSVMLYEVPLNVLGCAATRPTEQIFRVWLGNKSVLPQDLRQVKEKSLNACLTGWMY